jgi:hypothetical protein
MNATNFDLSLPFPDVFPDGWDEEMGPRNFMCFRNLDHFRHYVSKLSQKNDEYCGMSYSEALEKLMQGQSDFPEAEQQSIRNLVRKNLHKRGLITEEVYEEYKYSVDGTNVGVDVGKYASGEPDCVITPARQYIDFFYELYVSISYPWETSNNDIRKHIAKLLATIEELERQHIFIKITLILPIRRAAANSYDGPSNFFSSIPLFSHKDPKSVNSMSAVLNDRLLRKFYFAVLENLYGKDIAGGYGHPMYIQGAMNVGNSFQEIDFFEEVVKSVGA